MSQHRGLAPWPQVALTAGSRENPLSSWKQIRAARRRAPFLSALVIYVWVRWGSSGR